MFQTVPLSIISFSLYTQQWHMSYSLRSGSGHPVSKPVCIVVCTVKKLLMSDRVSVRNMQSSI